MADESLDRQTQILLKEAEWTWSEMEDFVKLVQRYRSLYVTALFISIGWVLGQALSVAPGSSDPSQPSGVPNTEFVLGRMRERPDIATVLCIVPMLNAVFFLLMMEATGHLQSLARYRYVLGWKLGHNKSPVWRWELWKETPEGSTRAWTNPSNIFLGLLALILTIGCFWFVFPAVSRSVFLFSLWATSIGFVLSVLAAVARAGWSRRHKNHVAARPDHVSYDTLFHSKEADGQSDPQLTDAVQPGTASAGSPSAANRENPMPSSGFSRSDLLIVVTLAFVALLVGSAIAWLLAAPDRMSGIEQLQQVAQSLSLFVAIGMLTGLAGMAATQFRKNLIAVRGRYHVNYLQRHFGSAWPHLVTLLSIKPWNVERRLTEKLPDSLFANSNAAIDAREKLDEGQELEIDDFRNQQAYLQYLRTSFSPLTKETLEKDRVGRETPLILRWDAPSGQVIAQLAQVAEYLVARPQGRVALLRRFVGENGSSALDQYVISLLDSPGFRKSEDGSRKSDDDLMIDLRHYIEQNLDSLLLGMSAEWRKRVRVEAAVMAMLVGFAGLLFGPAGPWVKVSSIVVAGIFGAFFAWFARDAVAVVEKWRS